MRLVMRRFHSGERVPFLLDEQGVPLFWPMLFATVRLRNAGLAFNTIRNKLSELKTLLRWEQFHGRDLEREFRDGRLLSVVDVVSIRDYATTKRGRANATRGSTDAVARFPEASLAPVANRPTVTEQVHYNRMTTIADYVEFLGQTVTAHRCDRELAAAVGEMTKCVREHRPKNMSSGDVDDPHRMSPPTELAEEFIRVGSEGHPDNPFRPGTIQRRNELIFRLLFETTLRLGELLSLRLDNMELSHEPTIQVRRTHDDRHDPRAYQPVAKTKEGDVDISDDLGAKIHRYCIEDRGRTPGANRHPYLFVAHRMGRTCGQPLSASAVSNKVFGAMQRVRPEFSEIRPHSFRHHKNYDFSKKVDEHNRRARSGEDPTLEPISEGQELRMRAQQNRHRSLKSGEAYNRRHVREATHKAVLDTQQRQWDQAKQSRGNDDVRRRSGGTGTSRSAGGGQVP